MTVLLVLEHKLTYNIAPASRAIHIASELKKQNIPTIIVGSYSDDKTVEPNVDKVVKIRTRFSGYLLKFFLRLSIFIEVIKILNNNQINNSIIRGSWPYTYLLPLMKIYNVKTFFDFHGYVHIQRRREGYKKHSFFLKLIEYFSLKNSDYIIAQSEYNSGVALNHNSEVMVLENGVDLDLFDRRSKKISEKKYRADYNIPKDKKIVGFVAGHFGNWIDFDCMLKASNLFNDNLHFVVVGDMSYVKIKNPTNYPRVVFTGGLTVSELTNLLSIFDICIYSINQKYINPFPMSPRKIIDWIAMELPIVVTDFNPKPRYLVENSNVLFSAPGSVKDLAANVNYLFSNKKLLESMKEYNKNMRDDFSWKIRVDKSQIIKKMKINKI